MPEPYWPKHRKKNSFTLSDAGRNNDVIKVSCRYCKRARLYETGDLIEAFGDIEVDDVIVKMHECRQCRSSFHSLDVSAIGRRDRAARGIIRRKRVLVWRDES